MSDAPYLDCPECGEPLIQADARVQFFDEHSDGFDFHLIDCRCKLCEWSWTETAPVTCPCGATARVNINDDDGAYAELVPPFIVPERA